MKELGVGEAAAFLGKSERMVRLYITEKTLKAKKIGKKWFIDRKSAEALRQSLAELPEKVRKSPEVKAGISGNDGPNRLACFRLARQAFTMPLWQRPDSALGNEISTLRTTVLKALGAGYYSYGKKKQELYAEARAQVGAALGLIYSDTDLLADGQKEVVFLEEKLMPALNALIKSMERCKGEPRYEP